MKSLLLVTSTSLLLLAPVSAQVFGSTNANAPTCTSSIAFADGGKVSLSYTSITWAGGNFETGMLERRDQLNAAADKTPIGKLMVEGTTVRFGGRPLPAGKYDVKFNINEKKQWVLVVASKGDKVRHDWVLPLEKAEKKQDRLRLLVEAGSADDGLRCKVAFGDKKCSVRGQKVEKQDGPSTGEGSTSRRSN